MKTHQIKVALLVLFLIGLGLTFFLTLYFQIPSLSLENHRYSFSFLPFLFTLIGSCVGLFLMWKLMALCDRHFFSIERQVALHENIFPLLPLSFFLLSPICLKSFILQKDFRVRMNHLLVFVLAAVVLTKIFQLSTKMNLISLWEKSALRFTRLPRKKKLILLFVVAFLVYQLCTVVIVSKGLAFSGDEPWYLMTTHSLYQDQDINVANNYNQQDYFHFYPKTLYPKTKLGIYGRFGKKGTDWIFPINQPGISVMMLPFYALSQVFEERVLIFIIKGSLSIWAALLGVQLFLLSNGLWKKEKISLVLWFLYSFSVPILFYAFHLYPEVPIALFSVYLFRKILEKGPFSTRQYLFFGFVLSLFIWFGLKYNMIFWPLLFVSGYLLLKEQKAGAKILAFLAFPVLSLVLFYLYVHALYGTYNPISLYEGVLTPEKIAAFKQTLISIPLLLRIDTFFDYFLDQRDGLLLYSPLYFFSFLGIVEAFRKAKKELVILLFLSAPFVLNYALLSHRQGSCPQGRVLTPVTWIMIVFVGYFLVYNKKKFYSVLFWIACALGLITAAILLTYPGFLYQPTTHEFTFRGGEFFINLSNLGFYMPSILPSFIKVNNVGYLPNYIWLGLFVLFFLGYIRKTRPQKTLRYPRHTIFVMAGLLIFFVWFSLFPKFTFLDPVNVAYETGEKITFYSLERHQQMREPGRFLLSKDVHTYIFTFTSWRELEDITIDFGSLDGTFKATLKLFDSTLFEGETSKEMKTLRIPAPPAYRYKKTNLYRIQLELTNMSDFSAAENPYLFIIHPSD
ncbi:MAG: hypothetical protein MUP98_06360 [Candidatus Aminicenantes bacterium]|nr:hypothetical protein [Candidatus Aminicenantes bacterium]